MDKVFSDDAPARRVLRRYGGTSMAHHASLGTIGLTCLLAAAAPAALALNPEVQVTPSTISDFEFDWGRNGVYCPTCNEGRGNARFAFSDSTLTLWVANVDPDTGAFIPPNGHGVVADTGAAAPTTYLNGPEWMFSTAGSQITYVKYAPGLPQTTENAGVAVATQAGGVWQGAMLAGSEHRFVPFGSEDLNDPRPRLVYQSERRQRAYWRYVDDPASEQPVHPLTSVCSRRWVPGMNALVFIAPCAPVARQLPQLFWIDLASGEELRITTDPVPKVYAFAWRAPEFNNDLVALTVADRRTMLVYRRSVDGSGQATWSLASTRTSPEPVPYITSPEPFVHNGRSYVVMRVSASPDLGDNTPSDLAVSGIEPGQLDLRLLTDTSAPSRVRSDPEYYITSKGPYVYFNRYIPASDSLPRQSEGVWRIDLGLGPPAP
jgi:hypothetical protein